MALLSTEAIVLGGMRLGEADKLVTFFTTGRGKLKGVAKGARRMKSRFGASLEPFTHCKVIVFEKGVEKLARINQCDIIHSFQSLREDWSGIDLATRMVKLVTQMTPDGEKNGDIFKLLLQGLCFLETGQDRPLSTILFMNRFISYSGYQPIWDHCLKCRRIFKSGARQPVYFSPSSGGTICYFCAKGVPKGVQRLVSISHGTRAFLNASQKMDYVLSHRLKPSSLMKKEIEALLAEYLSYITGKPPQRFESKPIPSLASV